MIKMKSFSKVVALLLCIAMMKPVLNSITPIKQLGSASLLKNDIVYLDLSKNFNFKNIKYPATATGKNGISPYLYDQPYTSQKLTGHSFTTLNFAKVLNDDFIMFVYDDNQVVIQHVAGEGKSFTRYAVFDLNQQEETIICTDGAFYKQMNRFFIGCFTKQASKQNPGNIYIFTINGKTEKIVYTVKESQGTEHIISSRLRMFFNENPYQKRNNDVFLIIYDQRHPGSSATTSNFFARILRNIEIGKPKFYKTAKITGLDFDHLYDIFPYENSLIAVGYQAQVNYIQLMQCSWNLSDLITCTQSGEKTTTVSNGLVGLDQRYNRYYEIDLDKKSIRVSTLEGSFDSASWNTNVIKSVSDLNLYQSQTSWIRDYTESEFTMTINFSSANNVDEAFTGVSLFNGAQGSWTATGSAVANGRSLVFAKQPQSEIVEIGIYRPQTPFALVRGTELSEGENDVEVSISDQETTTPITEKGTFTLLKSVHDNIQVSGSGQIVVQQGTPTYYPFKTGEITQGNALSVTVSDPSGNIKGTGYDLLPTKMDLTPPLSKYSHLSVYEDKFLVQFENKLLFYTCTNPDLATYKCFLKKTIILDEQSKWDHHKRLMSYKSVAFTWICNEYKCFAIFFDSDSLNSSQVLLAEDKTTINDAMITNDYQDGIRLIASFTESIKFWKGTTTKLNFSSWTIIDKSNAPVQQFCPKNIFVCPDSNFIFEAYNDCDGFNQKIMKWTARDLPFSYRTSVTGYSDYPDGFFCPMGDEFIVSSTTQNAPIYSFFTEDDLSYWSTPEEFRDASNYKHNCLAEMKRAVFQSYNPQKTYFNIMVIYGNRGMQQIRRYPIIKTGLLVTDAEAFVGNQQNAILHLVFDNNGHPKWYQSFDGPVVKIESTGQPGTYHPDFTFSNIAGKTYTVKKAVIVNSSNELEGKIMDKEMDILFKKMENME